MAGIGERLVTEARSAGMVVTFEEEDLVLTGLPDHEDLAVRLLDHKPDVLAFLQHEFDREVGWRFDAIRPQIPINGPVPVLVAREVDGGPGCCLSCGDPVEGKWRCHPCLAAIERALDEVNSKRQTRALECEL
jgi:hypothetical protein